MNDFTMKEKNDTCIMEKAMVVHIVYHRNFMNFLLVLVTNFCVVIKGRVPWKSRVMLVMNFVVCFAMIFCVFFVTTFYGVNYALF